MKPKINDYARTLSQGKSFNFSTWDAAETYRNDSFKQDFVVYDNNIYVCKESVMAGELNPAADIAANGYEANWQIVLKSDKGFSEWSNSDKEKLISSFLQVTSVNDVLSKAKAIGENPPTINASDGHWYFWNTETNQYEDSGKSSTGLLINKVSFTREYGELPGYIKDNQHYVLGSDKIYDDDGNELKGIGTMQRMDIALNDGTVKRTYIPDGLMITAIRQSHRATESGEDNVFTVVYNNGARTQLYVRNGMDGMAFKRVDSLPVGQEFESGYNLLNLPNSRYLYLMEDFVPLTYNGFPVYTDGTNQYRADALGVYRDASGTVIDPVALNYNKVPDPDAESTFSEYLWVENAIYLDDNGHAVYQDINDSSKVYYADASGNYAIDTTDSSKYQVVTGAYDKIGSAEIDLNDYVSYSKQDGYSIGQKLQARENIDACGDLSTIITVNYDKDSDTFTHSTIASAQVLKSWTNSSRRRIEYIETEGGVQTKKGEFYNFDIISPEGSTTDYFRFNIKGKYLDVKISQNITSADIDFAWETDIPYIMWTDQEQAKTLTNDQKENARINIDSEFIYNKDRLTDVLDPDSGLVAYPATPLNSDASDEHYPSSANVIQWANTPGTLTVSYDDASDPKAVSFMITPTSKILRDFLASPMKGLCFTYDAGTTYGQPISPEYVIYKTNYTGTSVSSRVYDFYFHDIENDRYVILTITNPTSATSNATATLSINSNLYVRTDFDQSDYLTVIEKATGRYNINAASLYSELWKVDVNNTVVTEATDGAPEDKLAWVESAYKAIEVTEGTETVILPCTKYSVAESRENGSEYEFEFTYDTSVITMKCKLNADLEVTNETWTIVSNKKHIEITVITGSDKYQTPSNPTVSNSPIVSRVVTNSMSEWLAAPIKSLSIDGTERALVDSLYTGWEAIISSGTNASGNVYKWILRIEEDGTMSIIDATHEVKVTEQVFDNEEKAIARHNINASPLYSEEVWKASITGPATITEVTAPTDKELWLEASDRVLVVTIDGTDYDLHPTATLPIKEENGAVYKYEADCEDYRINLDVTVAINAGSNIKTYTSVFSVKSLIKNLVVTTTNVAGDKYLKVENPVAMYVDPAVNKDDCKDINDWLDAEVKTITINNVKKPLVKVAGGWEADVVDKFEINTGNSNDFCRWILHIDETTGDLSIIDGSDHEVKVVKQILDSEEKTIARHNINVAPLYSEKEWTIEIEEPGTFVTASEVKPTNEELWLESDNRLLKVIINGVNTIVPVNAVLPLKEEDGSIYTYTTTVNDYDITLKVTLAIDVDNVKTYTEVWTIESNTKELIVNVTTDTDKYKTPTVTSNYVTTVANHVDSANFNDWNSAKNQILKLSDGATSNITPFVEQLDGSYEALISEGKDGTIEWKWILHIANDGTLSVIDGTHYVKYTAQSLDQDERAIARKNINAAPLYAEYWKLDYTDRTNPTHTVPTDISAWIGSDHRQVELTDENGTTVHDVETIKFPILNDPDPEYEFTFKEGDYRYTLTIKNNLATWSVKKISAKIFILAKKNNDFCETPLICNNHSWSSVDGYMSIYTLTLPKVNDDTTSPNTKDDFDDWKDAENKYIYVNVEDSTFNNIHGTAAEANYTNMEYTYDESNDLYVVPIYTTTVNNKVIKWSLKINEDGEIIRVADNSELLYIPQTLGNSERIQVAVNTKATLSSTDKYPILILDADGFYQSLEMTDATVEEKNAWVSSNERIIKVQQASNADKYVNAKLISFYASETQDYRFNATFDIDASDKQIIRVSFNGNDFSLIQIPKNVIFSITGTEGTDVYKTPTNLKIVYDNSTSYSKPGVAHTLEQWINSDYKSVSYNNTEIPFDKISDKCYKTIISEGTNTVDGIDHVYKWSVLITISGSVEARNLTATLTLLDEANRLPYNTYKYQYLASTANTKTHIWKNYFQNDDPDAMRWLPGDIFQYVGEIDKESTTDSETPKIKFKPGGIYRVSFTSTEVTIIDTTTTPVKNDYTWSIATNQLYQYNGADWVLIENGYRKDDKFYIKNPDSVTYDVLFERTMIPASNEKTDEVLMSTADKRVNTWGKYVIKKVADAGKDENGKDYSAKYTLVARTYAADGTVVDTPVEGSVDIGIGSVNAAAIPGTGDKIKVSISDANAISAEIITGSLERTDLDDDLNDELDLIGYGTTLSVVDTTDGKTDAETTLSSSVNVLDKEIGDANTLTVSIPKDDGPITAKVVVEAINQLDTEIGDETLTTANTEVKGAINELNTNIGDLTTLTTTAKDDLVSAINEINIGGGSMIWKGTLDVTGLTTLANTEPFVSNGCKKGYVYNIKEDGGAGVTIDSVLYSNADWFMCYEDTDPAAEPKLIKFGTSITYAASSADDGDFIIFD